MPKHNGRFIPNNLYKYASPETARAVIENGSLRFSRPALFNDDFELKVPLGIEVDIPKAVESILQNLWLTLSGDETAIADNRYGQILRSMSSSSGMTSKNREDFNRHFSPIMLDSLSNLGENFPLLSRNLEKKISNMELYGPP